MTTTTSSAAVHGVHERLHALMVPIESVHVLEGRRKPSDRKNTDAARDFLLEHGQRRPIVVKDPGHHVEPGQGRWEVEAAKELGWTHIAVQPFTVTTFDSNDEALAVAIYRMMYKSDPHKYLGQPPSPPIIRAAHVEVAMMGTAPIGAVLWHPRRDKVVRMSTIATSLDFRRVGVSTALIERFTKLASADGCPKVVTTVIDENIPMRKLVERHGFRLVETKRSTKRRICMYELDLVAPPNP